MTCLFICYMCLSFFKVPAFETADETAIYETNAIAYYGITVDTVV